MTQIKRRWSRIRICKNLLHRRHLRAINNKFTVIILHPPHAPLFFDAGSCKIRVHNSLLIISQNHAKSFVIA